VSEHRSYTGSPRDYQPPWHLCIRVSHNTGVTLAVSGLSQDWHPYEVEEVKLLKLHRPSQDYPRTPELYRQSQYYQYPGTTRPPDTPVSEYPRMPAVPGLSRDYQRPWDPYVRVSQNTGVKKGSPRDYQHSPWTHPCV